VEPADPDDPGDPDTLDDSEPTGLADGDVDGAAADPDEAGPDEAGPDEADPDEADPDEADPGVADPGVAGPAGADVLGWVGGLGASCLQAAMITRSLAGSALPPTPLRSTK